MKLNVLQLNTPATLAGAERVLLNYLACHDADRFAVTVASFVNSRRQSNAFTEELEKRDIPFRKIPVSYLTQGAVLRETVRLIRDCRIDLVHSHGYRSDIIGYMAARRAGVPIVSTVHGWTPVTWKLRRYEQLDRWFLKRFDGVIGVSREIVDSLLECGVQPDRVRLFHNAVPVSGADEGRAEEKTPLVRTPGERIILTVGRLSSEKGIDILLRAFHRYCSREPGTRLVIVGDGPLRVELAALAEELGLADRVLFAGYTNTVERYYKVADLFVLPSRTEGLPMVILEAMQAGLPVVCTRVGGIPEVIDNGITGVSVPPEDSDALGRAMSMVLGDPALASKLADLGRKSVYERFSAESWAKKIEGFYQNTVTEYARSTGPKD